MTQNPTLTLPYIKGGNISKLLSLPTTHRVRDLKMYIDRLVLIFLAGAYLLSPTTIEWWSLGGLAWWRPFLIWFLLILLSFWISKNRDRHDL